MRIIKAVKMWLSRCTVCGCSEMDCWGRCKRCGSDMHE